MKAKVCAALLLGGVVAMIWGYYGAGTSDESSLARTARSLGIAVMIAALLMLLNYHYASRLVLAGVARRARTIR